MADNRPIGIFDSGVGGLTVANAIRNILPNEQLIYFGDTAHLPYGDKSRDTIIGYSLAIAKFLKEQNCKVIVIACNSASSNAFESVCDLVPEIPVINVIDPIVKFVSSQEKLKHIGVIGTKSTVGTNVYQEKITQLNKTKLVSSMATPLFVPMIEEGFIFDDISNAIIRNYLSRHEIKGIDALILGCTHYPIIKNQINKFYNFDIDIIDSSKVVAMHVQKLLNEKELLSTNDKAENKYFVSDYTDYFQIIAKMFFEEDINLELVHL